MSADASGVPCACACACAWAIISAMTPLTDGAAMLVPGFCTVPVRVREWAANTAWSGAETSGFCRPSLVGPELEKKESGREASWAS